MEQNRNHASSVGRICKYAYIMTVETGVGKVELGRHN